MNASELRIGNYVSNPPLSECRKIDYLDICDHAESRLIQPFEPIPLTEEWLLRFGWRYQDRDVNRSDKVEERFYISPYFGTHREYWLELQLESGNTFKHSFMWLNWNIGGGNHFVHFPHGHEIKYVHQLQNLYFALTGKELELNTSTIQK